MSIPTEIVVIDYNYNYNYNSEWDTVASAIGIIGI